MNMNLIVSFFRRVYSIQQDISQFKIVTCLHVGDLSSLIADSSSQLASLLASNDGIGSLWASSGLDLLDLHAIPLLHLGTLVVVDLLVLVTDLTDGVGQLGLEELARVESDVEEGLLAQVLELLCVHLTQEAQLLLQTVLLVLELHALQCLRVQFGRDALDLTQKALSLDFVSLKTIEIGLIKREFVIEKNRLDFYLLASSSKSPSRLFNKLISASLLAICWFNSSIRALSAFRLFKTSLYRRLNRSASSSQALAFSSALALSLLVSSIKCLASRSSISYISRIFPDSPPARFLRASNSIWSFLLCTSRNRTRSTYEANLSLSCDNSRFSFSRFSAMATTAAFFGLSGTPEPYKNPPEAAPCPNPPDDDEYTVCTMVRPGPAFRRPIVVDRGAMCDLYE